MKTLLFALLLLLPGQRLSAEQVELPEIAQNFASCAGRLTALMQHQWLLSESGSDQTEAWRATMIDLLDAALPGGAQAGREALRYRLAARQAHAALLSRASFNDSRRDAGWAKRRAEAEIAQCQALMIW
ncbi:hypothetical protein R3X27_04585 [Tropicimonas sp. TH_r6]|uniref:hypothetical protein n=1 Tax=Tropicimonas sp. TH_r6 TaxID=3082085 RepID=UPI002952F63F|nr:hypothetical protein [Tropicimonas sp. TH_r6]MDV7141955.1 hypothetical protein [Tropicimonas sp. TH_r6]